MKREQRPRGGEGAFVLPLSRIKRGWKHSTKKKKKSWALKGQDLFKFTTFSTRGSARKRSGKLNVIKSKMFKVAAKLQFEMTFCDFSSLCASCCLLSAWPYSLALKRIVQKKQSKWRDNKEERGKKNNVSVKLCRPSRNKQNRMGIIFFFFYLFFQVHLLQVLISRKYEVLGQKSIEMTIYTNKTNLKLKFHRVVSAHKKN